MIPRTGAIVLLEQEWEKPLIRIACNHHVDERYYDAAVKAKFGDETTSPFQEECMRFWKWFDANRGKLPSMMTYDPENPPIRYDGTFLLECRAELEKLKERLTKTGHLNLPRGDYVHLWELIQVMHIMPQF